MSDAYEIFTGPFDDLKEKIVTVFEERAGLSERMAYTPKIDGVSPKFHTGYEPFTYNINTMHEIGGIVSGVEFEIHLARDRFSRDPGKPPRFHYHSITSIEIPGRVLFLFRGYPEYYISTQEPPLPISEFINIAIHRSDSPLCVKYQPNLRELPHRYKISSVLTDLVLYQCPKNSSSISDSFPKELPFSEVCKEFEKFLCEIIELLKTAPVKTRGMTE